MRATLLWGATPEMKAIPSHGKITKRKMNRVQSRVQLRSEIIGYYRNVAYKSRCLRPYKPMSLLGFYSNHVSLNQAYVLTVDLKNQACIQNRLLYKAGFYTGHYSTFVLCMPVFLSAIAFNTCATLVGFVSCFCTGSCPRHRHRYPRTTNQ